MYGVVISLAWKLYHAVQNTGDQIYLLMYGRWEMGDLLMYGRPLLWSPIDGVMYECFPTVILLF